MFCINCGTKLPDGAKFCMACGTKVVCVDANSAEVIVQDQTADIIKKGTKEKSIEFEIAEEEVRFDGAFRKYTADRNAFVNKFSVEISRATAETKREFQNCIETEKDKCLEILASYGEKLIRWTCDWGVDFLTKNDVYGVSHSTLLQKCAIGFQDFYDQYSRFEEGYLSIIATAEQMDEYRKLRHASRGRWQGGGFGIAGAIKGAATAGVLNLGGSIISGIGSAISGAIDRSIINKKKATYLNSSKWVDELRSVLIEGAELTFEEIYRVLSQKTTVEMPKLDRKQANIFFDNSRKAGSQKQRISVILKGLKEYPYNEKGYRLLLEHGDALDLDIYRMIEYFLPKDKWNPIYVLLKEAYSPRDEVLPDDRYGRLDAEISFMKEKIDVIVNNKEKMQFFANYTARFLNDDKNRLEKLQISRRTAKDGIVCASIEDLNIYIQEQPTYETYQEHLLAAVTLEDKLEILQQAKAENFKSEELLQRIEENIRDISSKIQDSNDFLCAKQRLEVTNDAECIETIKKLAGRGLEEAQIYLGELYMDTDPKQAVWWFQRAANNKSTEGRARLGDCYLNGIGVNKDEELAYVLISEAAKAGNIYAQYTLGRMLYDTDLVSKEFLNKYGDKKAALKWLHTTAENGYVMAQRKLAYLYEKGTIVPVDYSEAMRWYRKGAEQGESVCQHRVGQMYKDGKGVAQDYSEAAKWFLMSAENGNRIGQYFVGRLYHEGKGVAQNYTEAAKWYRMGAENGDADCQFWIGRMYYKGEGVQQDYAEAAKWYQMGAVNGDKYCQFQIGQMYYDGQGVQQDYAEAAKWYRMGAENGHKLCQFWIGRFFEIGKGVSQNYAEAAKWYQRAADQGHDASMNNLALLYEYGQGVPKDHKKALSLLSAAIEAGNEQAKENYKSIKRFFD